MSGGARNAAMLIAGRTVQGLGTAGLFVLSDIIICDVVPPRYRGPYLSAVISTAGIGSTIGPVIGGALAQENWRWIFYLNLPICAIGFVVILLFLKVEKLEIMGYRGLAKVDWIGTLLFVPSIIAIFYALITGGIQHPWSSWRVILPLVLGIVGWIAFHIFEGSGPRFCPWPCTPPRLFTNRTSLTGYLLILFSSAIFQAVAYFLPVYFQAVKSATPLLSGVYYLPFALSIIPFAGLAGWLLSAWDQYRPLHYAGMAFLAAGVGLLTLLRRDTVTRDWVGLQFVQAAGTALMFTATLPSTLAALSERDMAVATATYSFVRSLGLVWGVTVASVVFNGQIDAHLYLIDLDHVRDRLRNGAAYAFAASGEGLKSLDQATREQVMQVYLEALRVVWYVSMAVALLGLVCVPLEKQLELRTEHEIAASDNDEKREDVENRNEL